ncbi:HpcH/HpaI aldolase family protein [Thermomonospora catenispora]|uniref:HpcH/HpaI aldolase family protein n=1 Tax=Thermomonospora catenispora TaxID=2493090 RepID=UPI0011233E0E|nr:aldolase/citrate lyase family protein [Thermomonospora catenispora]TNY35498.1 2,4-dihydroxyhept-2-ene-1,7-dioic acid aldolase [Thermomonospora catenispora]
MLANRLKDLFAAGRTVVNGWLSAASPYLAEVLSHAGYDSVTVDLQHGMFGPDQAVHLIQAVSAGPAVPLARTSSRDAALIGKLLDAGAYGIICPAVDDAAQAAEFVAMCRYPPTGIRSYGPARADLRRLPGYVAHADAHVMTWAMIESRAALENLEEIAATPGLDGVFVGPNDLALALGAEPGRAVPPPEVAGALRRVVSAAHAAGVLAGAFCADGAAARRLAGQGYDFVTPGNDMAILRRAAAEGVALARGGAPDAPADGGY